MMTPLGSEMVVGLSAYYDNLKPKVSLQYRELVRAAKRLNVNLHTGIYDDGNKRCAIGLIGSVLGTSYGEFSTDKAYIYNSYRRYIGDKFNIDKDKLEAIEVGFERWLDRPASPYMSGKLGRYYNIGKKLRAIASKD